MQVVERFISINGEGMRAGEPAVFIRFKGCNLACSYCDTAWANEPECEYEDISPEAISDYVKETGIHNVVLTGGEPVLQEDLVPLIRLLLKDPDIRVEIETNGSIPLKEIYRSLPCDRLAVTMDYKLPSSNMENHMDKDNLDLLGKNDTVKFVSGSKEDLSAALDIINKYGLTGRCNVHFSPVFGKIDPQEITAFLIDNKLNGARLQLQIHKLIWDPDKRGV